jgi:hypothetical protein
LGAFWCTAANNGFVKFQQKFFKQNKSNLTWFESSHTSAKDALTVPGMPIKLELVKIRKGQCHSQTF